MRRHVKTSTAGLGGSLDTPTTRLLVILLLALTAALASSATPASATTVSIYQPIDSFNGAGTPAGALSPSKLAMHQSTETLYVFDAANGGVVKFDSSGTPQNFTALGTPVIDGSANSTGRFIDFHSIAVDNSGGTFDGDIYVADRPGAFDGGRVSVFNATGSFLYEFEGTATQTEGLGDPLGLAIDSTGAIFVSGFYADAIRKFIPTDSPPAAGYDSEISIVDLGGRPEDLAIDSSDNIYVSAITAAKSIFKLTPSGSFDSQILNQTADGIATNPSTDHIYADLNKSVIEYDASGSEVGQFGFGTVKESKGITAAGGSGNVYVADSSPGSVHVFALTNVTVPDVTIAAPSEIEASSATLNGIVDPLGVPSSFHFEYRPQGGEGEWASTPENTSLDSGGGAQGVSANASGLEAGTSYEVRMISANTDAGSANGAFTTSGVATFTTNSQAPTLLTSPTAVAGITSTTLYAELIPHGVGTTYHFEYGTNTSYGAVVPASEGDVGGGPNNFFEPQSVSEAIAGLSPNTIYHFRVVATNIAGTTIGSDLTFKTLDPKPPKGLPDGRVYEKVSPQDKNGGDVERRSDMHFFHFLYQVATAGDAITWASVGNAGGDGGALYPQYFTRRDASGWVTRGITPRLDPQPSVPNANFYTWFSDDLSKGLVRTSADLHSGDPTKHPNLYLFNSAIKNDGLNSAFDLFSPSTLVESIPGANPYGVDGSKDSRHILFVSEIPLDTPNGQTQSPEKSGLYEWTQGEIRYVGILPDNTAAAESAPGTAYNFWTFPGYNTISDDGARIFFTVSSGEKNLYLREKGTETRRIATDISRFLFAKPSDGSVAFFSKTNGGDCDTSQGPQGPQGLLNECADLYRWDANAASGEELVDLTTADQHGGGVLGVLGASDDATKIYFGAVGDLASGASRDVPNIYLWQQGRGIRHIVTLSADLCNGIGTYVDNGMFNDSLWGGTGNGSPSSDGRCTGQGGPPFGGARVTPDGEHLLFDSFGQITPYDNAGRKQVYLYSLATDQITCISCNARTAHSTGGAYLNFITEHEAYGDASLFQPRNLSSDGRRIFFDSTEALVPQDTNGKVDVYEWTDGAVHLISSGSSGSDSTFMGASDDGDDVFFGTAEPLVRSDGDPFYDVYDARVGGITEPAPIPGCTGDECQGTPTPPPLFGDPGTSGLKGPGNPPGKNLRTKKCGKGKSRSKKGRCVRKQHRQAQGNTTRRHG